MSDKEQRVENEYGPAPPRDKIKPAEDDPSVEASDDSAKVMPPGMTPWTETKEYVWHYVQEDGQKTPKKD